MSLDKLLFGAALALAACIGTARADDLHCAAAEAGRLSCQAGIRCECKYFSESRMTGTGAGYRWDCGILRGRCDLERPGDLGMPATLPEIYPGPYPHAVTIDRSDNSVTNSVNQSQSNSQVNTQTQN
jgi:hypothetical protein